MAAFMLLMTLVLMVVNLAFTVRLWREVGGVSTKRPTVKIPRGKRKMEKENGSANEQIDVNALVASTLAAMELNAEESGEPETQLTPEQMAEIVKNATGSR